MNNTRLSPGPWTWRTVSHHVTGKLSALLLETEHRPVPWNDPVIMAIREDWLGHFVDSPDAKLIAASRQLLAMIQELLGTCELNMDMEPATREVLARAVDLITPFEEMAL